MALYHSQLSGVLAGGIGRAVYLGGFKMHALNASTGVVLWASTSGVGSSPAMVDGLVYEGSDSGAVYA
jgi:outer membrane protein assembly factor BamB